MSEKYPSASTRGDLRAAHAHDGYGDGYGDPGTTERHTAPRVDPTVKVARDLTEILDLSADLEAQAEARHDDPDMPGGTAMAMLGPVGNAEAAEYRYEHATQAWYDDPTTTRADYPELYEDPDWEPPLQTLLWWSDSWREERGNITDMAQTIVTEAGYLRQILGWAYETEPRWDDFATDIRKARGRLENELHDGVRSTSGAPCLQCATPLVRVEYARSPVPKHCPGHEHDDVRLCPLPHHREGCVDRGGLQDRYRCTNPRCGVTTVSEQDYRRAVGQTHLAHADRLSAADMERRTGVRPGTLRQWANRGMVRRLGRHPDGRLLYSVEDVEARQGETAC